LQVCAGAMCGFWARSIVWIAGWVIWMRCWVCLVVSGFRGFVLCGMVWVDDRCWLWDAVLTV